MSESKASQVYKLSSRTARATERNPVLEKKQGSHCVVLARLELTLYTRLTELNVLPASVT